MLSTSSCLHKVKQAQQCLESGELDDFKQELEYISTTLLDESASHNLKHLRCGSFFFGFIFKFR